MKIYNWGLDLAGQRSGKVGQSAGGIGGLISIREISGATTNTYFPICDHNGNIHKIVDDAGSIVANYEYSPFGVLIGEWGSKKKISPFKFSSKYYDEEAGMYYYGYRYYDPASTKWLSRDPKGEAGGINLTAFCRNDPVNNVDPFGQDVYIVYREFASELLEKFYLGANPAGMGHYYLAFDDKNVDQGAWSKLVDSMGGQADPFRLAQPSHETFSFHPWSVRIDNQGNQDLSYNISSTLYTLGTYVGYNDKTDIQSFLNAKKSGSAIDANVLQAKIFKVNTSQKQQFDLYKAAVKSRNINNISATSSDFGKYMVLRNNCGSWAVHMVKSQGLKIPKGVCSRNVGGTGIGGIQDYLPFTRIMTAGAAGYGYTRIGAKQAYQGGRIAVSKTYQGGKAVVGTTFDISVMTILAIDEMIKKSGGQYDVQMLSDDTVGIGIKWDL